MPYFPCVLVRSLRLSPAQISVHFSSTPPPPPDPPLQSRNFVISCIRMPICLGAPPIYHLNDLLNVLVCSTLYQKPQSTHRVTTAAFWRTFHHEGKISHTANIYIYIYISLTDTCMWKLGQRPHIYFSENICSNFRYWSIAVWANFSIVMECAPEIGRCRSVNTSMGFSLQCRLVMVKGARLHAHPLFIIQSCIVHFS
jgi:hypothetical protein